MSSYVYYEPYTNTRARSRAHTAEQPSSQLDVGSIPAFLSESIPTAQHNLKQAFMKIRYIFMGGYPLCRVRVTSPPKFLQQDLHKKLRQ